MARMVRKQIERMVGHFEVRLGDNLPMVHMAAGRIEQVVVNLLLNAAQASAGPEDSRVAVYTARDGRSVLVGVEDNGPGVPPEDREKIFQPFYSTKAHGEGTGLGLPLCRKLVEAQGGQIVADEAPLGGARLAITLPLLQEGKKL